MPSNVQVVGADDGGVGGPGFGDDFGGAGVLPPEPLCPLEPAGVELGSDFGFAGFGGLGEADVVGFAFLVVPLSTAVGPPGLAGGM